MPQPRGLTLRIVVVLALALATAAQCPAPVPDAGPPVDLDGGPEPVFPADLSALTEVRDCRHSHEHELRHIRVLADALALEVYDIWTTDIPQVDWPRYPVGATLVKLEHDDDNCSTVTGYTAMQKRADGANPEGYDWWWQRLDKDRRVLEEGAPIRCIDCHFFHCEPPFGYDLTCAEEL